MEKRELQRPDFLNVPLNNGQGFADAQYKAARTLIFLSTPDEELKTYAEDRGFRVLVFPSDQGAWSGLFQDNREVFGGSE